MAYNKIINRNSDKDIKYLSKDFNSFKNQLKEFAEVYFPNHFNDFSEGNPGMMFLEMAAYVGDILSFYTDNQIQENFLALAQSYESLYNISYSLGYKPRTTSAASVKLNISQLIPSKTTTDSDGNTIYIPDYDYALRIKKNSTFASTEGPSFYLTEDADFNYSSSTSPVSESIHQYDGSNNPEYYLLTKQASAFAGTRKSQDFTIGAAEKFKTLTLFDTDIISIESIMDSEDNEWTEVDYLAQDTVFDEVSNTMANDPSSYGDRNETPYLLKLKKVPRRFITRVKPNNQIEIQFGSGISDKSDEQIIPNPDNIGLGIKDGRSKLNQAYDPSNFMYTKAYGQVPANTTLTVTYRVGGGLSSNVRAGTITRIGTIFQDHKPGVSGGMNNFVMSSLVCTNTEPARGGGGGDTPEDVRLNAIANFSTQQRTVTRQDYMVRALSMPPKFGSIAKSYIVQDDQISILTTEPNRIPNPLALNLYVLGYDSTKKLTTLNSTAKTNLATYLEHHRMLTDAINIKDAFIVNFSINFEITVYKNHNNQTVILDCINELKNYFNIDKWHINQPIIISDVKNTIGAVKGVQTVEDVTFENKSGTINGYSQYKYPINSALRNQVIYPSIDPCIFEIKYPNTDIQGRVTTY